MFMNKFIWIILLGVGALTHALIIGYKLDQMKYPHDNKHSIIVPKKLKKFLFLNRVECMRAAFILEMSGYIEFFLMLIIAILNAALNDSISNDVVRSIFEIFICFNTFLFLFAFILYLVLDRLLKKK